MFYFGSAIAGMSRTIIGTYRFLFRLFPCIGFPIEHPIDSIKTQWQAKPQLKNELAVNPLSFISHSDSIDHQRYI